ncbi:MAG: BTAD domain-containing putative transcriptional regulator, partial [Gemmataceae bacterium]
MRHAHGLAIRDAETLALLATLPMPKDKFLSNFSLAADGTLFLNINPDGVYRLRPLLDPARPNLYRFASPEKLPLEPAGNMIFCSADGRTVAVAVRAVGSEEPRAGVWYISPKNPDRPVRLFAGKDISGVWVSPDGETIVAATHSSNPVWLHDLPSERTMQLTVGQLRGVMRFTSNPDEFECNLGVFHRRTGQLLREKGLNRPMDNDTIGVKFQFGALELRRPTDNKLLGQLDAIDNHHISTFAWGVGARRLHMVDSVGTLHTWQLTRLRAELAKIGLDWPTEPLAPAPNLPPITQVLFENPERLGDAAYFQRLKTEKRLLRLWSNPLDLKAIDELSREEFNNRRYASGLKLSDFLLNLDPKNLEVRTTRQRMAFILGRHPEVILHANTILERKPDDHTTRDNRADALAALGRHAEALADYRLILRDAYPNNPFLQIAIGEQLQMIGDPAGALAEFRAAAKTVINNDSYSETTINNLAWYLVVGPPASRDPALALTLIDKAIRKKPDQSTFLNTHA